MKRYVVTYTENFGNSYECRVVESDSYTGAYLIVDLALPSCAAITCIRPI